MEEILTSGFSALGIPFAGETLTNCRQYYNALAERNRVMNLTAITGEEDAARLHFLDCAALLTALDFKNKRVIDVGTGAGFPGLPLKLAEPSIRLTLLDSLGKRVQFLEETVQSLGLRGVETVLSRAEEAPAALREQFDVATARAVTRLALLSELCLPFVRVGGVFAAMKGPDPEEEINEAQTAVQTLGGRLKDVRRYTIPGTDVVHSVVLIEKIAPTPGKYPRRWAKMQKEPIR